MLPVARKKTRQVRRKQSHKIEEYYEAVMRGPVGSIPELTYRNCPNPYSACQRKLMCLRMCSLPATPFSQSNIFKFVTCSASPTSTRTLRLFYSPRCSHCFTSYRHAAQLLSSAQSHCSLREAKSDDITLVSVSSARFVISLSTRVAIKKQYHIFAANSALQHFYLHPVIPVRIFPSNQPP